MQGEITQEEELPESPPQRVSQSSTPDNRPDLENYVAADSVINVKSKQNGDARSNRIIDDRPDEQREMTFANQQEEDYPFENVEESNEESLEEDVDEEVEEVQLE